MIAATAAGEIACFAGLATQKRRDDDPFGRGFEYVPFSDVDLYRPINELFSGGLEIMLGKEPAWELGRACLQAAS